VVVKMMNFGYRTSFQSLDKGLIENFGPTGFTNSFFSFARTLVTASNNLISNSSFIIVFFTLGFLTLFMLPFLNLSCFISYEFFLLVFAY